MVLVCFYSDSKEMAKLNWPRGLIFTCLMLIVALAALDVSTVVDSYIETDQVQVGVQHKFPWRQVGVTVTTGREETYVRIPLLYVALHWITFMLVLADIVMTCLQFWFVPRSWRHGLAATISSLFVFGCRVWTSAGLVLTLGWLWEDVRCDEDCITGAASLASHWPDSGLIASHWLIIVNMKLFYRS